MSRPKIYLIGKMSGLNLEQMNSWREDVRKMFKDYSANVHIENPCLYYNPVLEPHTYTEKEAKEFDLFLLKNCDLAMFNLDYPDSIGSAIECHLTHDIWNKPVIAFGGVDKYVHPWIELSLTKRCKTMKEAVEHIIDFYLPNI